MYVRMYVCMHNASMYVRVCMYVRMYVCMYVGMYVCMCVRTYVCMYVRMYVRTYLCMYVCMYACMYVIMYVCVCVGMYRFLAWILHMAWGSVSGFGALGEFSVHLRARFGLVRGS